MQAAQRLSTSKTLGMYKSTALNYLLKGFTEPYMLSNWGYCVQECYFCQKKVLMHFYLFCPAAMFIRSHLDEIVFRCSEIRIDRDPSQFNLRKYNWSQRQMSIAIATKVMYVDILHLGFHKKARTVCQKKLLIDIVNRNISGLRLTHPILSDLMPLRSRLRFSKGSKSFSKLRHESSTSHIRLGSEVHPSCEDEFVLSILSSPPSLTSEISQDLSIFWFQIFSQITDISKYG